MKFPKKMRPGKSRINLMGFTLMEVMAVMAIIVILLGLLSPALTRVRQQAREKRAEAMLGSLEVGINMYYADVGNYPAELEGGVKNSFNDSLGKVVTIGPATYGPYMKFKTSELDGNAVKDPWGKPYNYDVSPASGNTNSFNLEDGSGKGINNWE